MNIIDIIIVNYNSTECLQNCLISIFLSKNDISVNVIVVDNASTDNPECIMQLFPHVTFIKNKSNIGFAAAVNKGLKQCNAPFIVLLNPDTIITQIFFSSVLNFFKSHPNVGIIGPKVFNDDGSIQGSARSFPTPLTSLFGRNSPLTKLFPRNSITTSNILNLKNDGKSPMEVDWVSGACMILRKEVIEAVGYLDEQFFIYWEDADLCYRSKDAGWKIIYYPKAYICHTVGVSSSTDPYLAAYHFHRSSYHLFNKYTKWPENILQPIAFLGLSIRCFFIFLFQYLNQKINEFHTKQNARFIKNKKEAKILRVVSRLNIGGPSIHVSILTKALNSRFKSKLVTGTISKYEGNMSYLLSNSNGLVITVPELQREINPFKDLIAFIKIIQIVIKEKPDIVHTHLAKAGAIARIAVSIYNLVSSKKVKVVHTFHGHILEGYFNKHKTLLFKIIEQILAKSTDAIITISQTQRWELIYKYRITDPKKIHMINLGFDLTKFSKKNQYKGQFRKKKYIIDDTILIGIVGRLVPIKNHFMFLNAAKLFIERNNNILTKFIIIGDGELRDNLEQYSKNLGINNNLIFHGWERDIPMIYSDLDILVLTSNNEGTPVSIIEAMASSVPVITTGVGGVKDLLGSFIDEQLQTKSFRICERGLLCPKNDPVALAQGIESILFDNSYNKQDRTQKAREFVLNNYSDKKLIYHIESLYKSLIYN